MKSFLFLSVLCCVMVTCYGGMLHAASEYDPDQILESLKVPEIQLDAEYLSEIDRVLPSLDGEYFVVLNSGLTLLIKELDYSPVVSCRVAVKAGSIYEDEFLGAGVTHYLEHVVAGGSTSIRSEQENAELIKQMGGASNASTSYDFTTYFIKTIPENWKTAIELLYSYVTSCAFAESEVTREKPVILQELHMRDTDPQRQLWEVYMSTMYQKSPVRYPIIGYEPIFTQLTRDDLMKYYKSRYQPQNIVLSVVGNVNGIEVLKDMISMASGFQADSYKETLIAQEDTQISSRWVEQTHPAAQLTSMQIGVPTVKLLDDDLFALDVFAIILGSGRTSRLYKSLKDDKQLVLSVSAFNWTPEFVNGSFTISASLRGENVSESIEVMWNEIEEIKKNGITQEELERAKRKVLSMHIAENINADSISANLSRDYLATKDPHFNERYVSGVQKVTIEDITRVVNQYFVRNRQTVALIKPSQPIKAVVDDNTRELKEQISSELVTLPNGMKLIFKDVKDYPMVHFALFLKGGTIFENENSAGVSNFLASMLTRGTTSRSKDDISREIENIGGSLNASSGRHSIYLTSSVLAQDASKGLELLSDVALNPSFPSDEIEKVRQEILLSIEKKKESWQSEIIDYFDENFYTGHPYRFDALGTTESVSAMTRDDLDAEYDNFFVASNMVLAVYGSFDRKQIHDQIVSYFGGLADGNVTFPNIEVDTGEFLVQDKEIDKTGPISSVTLFYGLPGVTIDDPKQYPFDIIDAVISGIQYPSGWLHEGLRGQNQSLVYMVHAFPQFGVKGGHFGILSQTTPENYEEVSSITEDIIRKVSSEGITEDELTTAKSMCITMHELKREALSSQAFSDALNESIGLGYQHDAQYEDIIRNLTLEQVNSVASDYFINYMKVVIFPESYQQKNNE